MRIETVKSEGLAHLSYLVIDGGEAAVIDPRIDFDVYLDLAERHGARITQIFETHRNEDLVSGAYALGQRTGAEVLHGMALDFGYGRGVAHGATFALGEVELEVLHTPGHTKESISIALRHTETGEDIVGVFTGDALFVGDVGRTDLYPEQAREVAGMLYDSLHQVLLPLGDQALVWPAHGAGSVCGDGMADRDFSTLGYERQNNPWLSTPRQAFIDAKVAERHLRPPYFEEMERVNLQGHAALGSSRLIPVGPDELASIVVDVREPEAFLGGHVPGAYALPSAMIPSYAGWWLPYHRAISLVGDNAEQLATAVENLNRLGYTEVNSRLDAMVAWETSGKEVGTLRSVDVHELSAWIDEADPVVIDVRSPEDFEQGHVPGAIHVELQFLLDHLDELERDAELVTICASGRRATIAAGLLAREGYDNVAVCLGSMAAWNRAGLPVEAEERQAGAA